MCLEIDSKKNRADNVAVYYPHYAKEDMVVWKCGTVYAGGELFRPEYIPGFSYQKNTTTEQVNIMNYFKNGNSLFTGQVRDGYHAYLKKPHSKNYDVERFIIPKGSYYFIGTRGDIVSSSIMWSPKEDIGIVKLMKKFGIHKKKKKK